MTFLGNINRRCLTPAVALLPRPRVLGFFEVNLCLINMFTGAN